MFRVRDSVTFRNRVMVRVGTELWLLKRHGRLNVRDRFSDKVGLGLGTELETLLKLVSGTRLGLG